MKKLQQNGLRPPSGQTVASVLTAEAQTPMQRKEIPCLIVAVNVESGSVYVQERSYNLHAYPYSNGYGNLSGIDSTKRRVQHEVTS